jgi:predicted nucleotidyltransferase
MEWAFRHISDKSIIACGKAKIVSMKVENKIQEYFRDRPEVIAVYLFGSYAEGHERRGSDVDLGILLERGALANTGDITDEYVVGLGRVLRRDVHPVVLNTASESLLSQVFSKGRLLVVNDSEKLSRFRTNAFSKIAEFGDYKRSAQVGLIRRVMTG